MLNDEQLLKSVIACAIALTRLKPRSRIASENDRDRAIAAQTIIDHLKVSGWRFWKPPPDPRIAQGAD